MMTATVMETRVASGTASSTGMRSASSGTAIRASPKPKADRTSVAAKITASTVNIVQSNCIESCVSAIDLAHDDIDRADDGWHVGDEAAAAQGVGDAEVG